MSNVISIITRQPIIQANDRITSASLEYNRHMHLLAHGWNSRFKYFNGNDACFGYSKADENVWYDQHDAWKIQKLSEQARRYGI